MKWKIDTPALIKETIAGNPTAWILRTPYLIFRRLLGSVAERAIAIDDPELNILMLRLGLYDVPHDQIDYACEQQKRRLRDD